MFINYSLSNIYACFSKPFHVTIEIRQGGVLSPYLLDVYLDDLSLELNNIKSGCIREAYSITQCLLKIFVCFVQVYVGCKVC